MGVADVHEAAVVDDQKLRMFDHSRDLAHGGAAGDVHDILETVLGDKFVNERRFVLVAW